jgi:ubiquitin-protein ligase E3 A
MDGVGRYIRAYFTQFTVGCDRIMCTNLTCKSCPDFPYHFSDPNDAAVLACESALQRADLCPGLSPLVLKPQLRADLLAFERLARSLIVLTPSPPDFSAACATIHSVTANPHLFPYILGGLDRPFGPSDLAIDGGFLADFVAAVRRYSSLFIDLGRQHGLGRSCFEATVLHLINSASDTFCHVRALILVFAFEPYFVSQNVRSMLGPLLGHVNRLPDRPSDLFFGYLQRLPRHVRHIVSMLQNCLSDYVLQYKDHNIRAPHYREIAVFLSKIRELTASRSPYPLPSRAFWNETFTNLLVVDQLTDPDCYLSHSPAILGLSFKNDVFHALMDSQQNWKTRRALEEQERNPFARFLTRDDFIKNISFNLKIRRNHILDDTIRAIRVAERSHLLRKLMVTFEGEEALDVGGVSREYFHLLMSQLFSPDYGMFQVLKGKYWFNMTCIDDPITYKTLGTIVALAIYNQIILPIRFPLLLYKKLLGQCISLDDLVELDVEVVKSLEFLLDMRNGADDVADLMLTFSVGIDNWGSPHKVALIERGESTAVTNSNVDEYVRAYIDWFASRSIERQFAAFSEGFNKLFLNDSLKMFAPDELDILVSGEEVFEWDELEKNAKYSDGYRINSRAVKMFWGIFKAMPNEAKSRFQIGRAHV